MSNVAVSGDHLHNSMSGTKASGQPAKMSDYKKIEHVRPLSCDRKAAISTERRDLLRPNLAAPLHHSPKPGSHTR